jgi:HAD superfamily hydrolase (TIGR01549 family)
VTTRAVLFDVDGTLVDSTYHHAVAWGRAFAAHGITVPMWRIHRTIGMGGDKLVGEVAGAAVEEEHGDALPERWEEEYAGMVENVPALEGAADLVTRLHEDGCTIALASSGKQRFTEDAVRTLGIGDLVDLQTSSDDAEESKPEPDIFGVTVEKLGADEAVAVGDTPYDVEAAARIGLRCVAVLTGGFSRAELEDAGAAVVVESLAELVDADWSPYFAAATEKESA